MVTINMKRAYYVGDYGQQIYQKGRYSQTIRPIVIVPAGRDSIGYRQQLQLERVAGLSDSKVRRAGWKY